MTRTNAPRHTVDATDGQSLAMRTRRSRAVSLAYVAVMVVASLAGCGEGSGTASSPARTTVVARRATTPGGGVGGTNPTSLQPQAGSTPTAPPARTSRHAPSSTTPNGSATSPGMARVRPQTNPAETRHTPSASRRVHGTLGGLLAAACARVPANNRVSARSLKRRAELCSELKKGRAGVLLPRSGKP